MNFKKLMTVAGVTAVGAVAGVVAYKNITVVASVADKIGAVVSAAFGAAVDTAAN